MCHFNPREKSLKKILLLLLLITSFGFAQKKSASQKNVFVDKNGILRWEGSNKEVSLYGVNYTTPFAYSYRAQKKLGLNLKQAIDLDVGQVVRLGLDAFRVHVWDRQISDKVGNIIDNDHLNLFDYLISKLEANHIKIIVTPIAWWGTGWPEPDPKEKGFSQFYSKLELITNQDARKAERNYLTQFVKYINPFLRLNLYISLRTKSKWYNERKYLLSHITEKLQFNDLFLWIVE